MNDEARSALVTSVGRRRFRGGRGISATQLTLLLWITATSIDSRKAIRLKYRRSEWSACIRDLAPAKATMAGAFSLGRAVDSADAVRQCVAISAARDGADDQRGGFKELDPGARI